jgi:hypothetical protein
MNTITVNIEGPSELKEIKGKNGIFYQLVMFGGTLFVNNDIALKPGYYQQISLRAELQQNGLRVNELINATEMKKQ